MRTVTLTQKGWFGLCPVYMDAQCQDVHERHWALLPLLNVSLVVFDLLFMFAQLVSPAYEPEWPLKITGTLREPITVDMEDAW